MTDAAPTLDIVTVPFRGTVNALASTVLVSTKIDFPWDLYAFNLQFEMNTNRSVQARLFVAEDSNPDVSVASANLDLFGQYAQTSTFVGDDQPIRVWHTVRVRKGKTFLKLALTNLDAFNHAVDAQVMLARKLEFD